MIVSAHIREETSATSFCESTIEAPETRHFLDNYAFFPERVDMNATGKLTYASCLYAIAKGSCKSPLDTFIMLAAFLLLSVYVASDAKEQNISKLVRKHLPWRVQGNRTSAVTLFAMRSALAFAGLCFQRIVPALAAMSMLMLLIAIGADSTSVILNGLAVTFALELDNLVAPVFVSSYKLPHITAFATDILQRFERPSERKPTNLAARELTHTNELPVLMPEPFLSKATILFISTVWQLCHGFAVLTSKDSQISCEMMAYFLYYRIALRLGVWAPWLVQQVQELVGRVVQLVRLLEWCDAIALREESAARGGDRAAAPAKSTLVCRLLYQAALQLTTSFVEAFFCACVMNSVFWLACMLFFQTPLDVGFDAYFVGFLEDIFGFCAASGYKDPYGFDCLPMRW